MTKVVVPSLAEKKKTTRYRDGKVVTTTGAKVGMNRRCVYGGWQQADQSRLFMYLSVGVRGESMRNVHAAVYWDGA